MTVEKTIICVHDFLDIFTDSLNLTEKMFTIWNRIMKRNFQISWFAPPSLPLRPSRLRPLRKAGHRTIQAMRIANATMARPIVLMTMPSGTNSVYLSPTSLITTFWSPSTWRELQRRRRHLALGNLDYTNLYSEFKMTHQATANRWSFIIFTHGVRRSGYFVIVSIVAFCFCDVRTDVRTPCVKIMTTYSAVALVGQYESLTFFL